jgi:hypothetical protein
MNPLVGLMSEVFLEFSSFLQTNIIIKGKAVQLQTWSGPDYMTTAQDGGKVVSLTYRPPLAPENAPGTHFC